MPVPNDFDSRTLNAESKNLRAEDFDLDVKWKLKVSDVNVELMPERDGKPARNRLVLAFAGKEKHLVLNATNQGFIEARLGRQPNRWVGAEILLHRTTTTFAGKVVPAFRIIECRQSGQPARVADEEVPF